MFLYITSFRTEVLRWKKVKKKYLVLIIVYEMIAVWMLKNMLRDEQSWACYLISMMLNDVCLFLCTKVRR